MHLPSGKDKHQTRFGAILSILFFVACGGHIYLQVREVKEEFFDEYDKEATVQVLESTQEISDEIEVKHVQFTSHKQQNYYSKIETYPLDLAVGVVGKELDPEYASLVVESVHKYVDYVSGARITSI